MKLIYRCLCLVLGAVLGSGCSDSTTEPVEYGPMPEYGVPTGTVRIDGRVVDFLGAPIPGIQVSFNGARFDTTDAAGNWSIDEDYTYIPCAGSSTECLLTAKDIDGPDNGEFPFPSLVTLDLTQTKPGSGNYDQGTWEQHDIDVVMDDAVEYGPPLAKVKGPTPPVGKNR